MTGPAVAAYHRDESGGRSSGEVADDAGGGTFNCRGAGAGGMARAWLAAALAFLYPGLGHVYLRAWLRALAWFGLAFSTVAWLLFAGVIPESVVDAAGDGGVESLLAASRALPVEARVAVFLVTLFNVVDAYLIARQSRRGRDGESCPECGRELDEELEFCPWCTTRLDDPTSR